MNSQFPGRSSARPPLFFWLLSVLCFAIPAGVESQNLLRSPESIVFDSLNNRYLLSNYDTGSIVQIDSLGNQSYFVFEQGAIQGLEIAGNSVYAGCGLTIRGFDLATGQMTLDVPIPGAVNLNDVTVDTSGNLYASDVYGHAIYKIRLSDQVYSTFASQSISYPNGICFDEIRNRLLVCSFRYHSPIQSIDLEDSAVSTVTSTSISDCDGLTRDDFGNCYVSSWTTRSIYRFDSTFTAPPERIYVNSGGPADIAYNSRDDVLAIPLMLANSYDLVPIVPTSVRDRGETAQSRSDLQLRNTPNPFSLGTALEFTTFGPGSGRVSVHIFDLQGRLVRPLIETKLPGGRHLVAWDGTDRDGRRVASGVYLCVLRNGRSTTARRLTLLH